MPLSPARVFRTFRYAMFFDGVDDYVRVPSYGDPTVFTVEAWFYTDRIAHQSVASKNEYAWRFGFPYVAGSLGFRGVNSDGTLWVMGVDPAPYINRWVHAAGVADVGIAKLYADASLVRSTSWKNSFYLTGRPLYIGVLESGTSPPFSLITYFKGYISQIIIYSRALSDLEIQWNYSNPDNPIRNGLILWLRAHPDNIRDIDGDGLLEWLDLSGYGNHGKIYGARLVELIRTPARTLTVARTVPVVR
jgi:hypothetical protein